MHGSNPETIADVAEIAGVSASTVSRVINNSGYVGKKTREKVEQVLSATGFLPNMAAKTLVTSKTHLVGFILPTFNNPVYLELLKGVHEAAIENSYSVVIGQRGEEQEELEASFLHLASLNVDGIISTIPEYHAVSLEKYLQPFLNRHFSLVQLGKGNMELGIDGVSSNTFEAGFQIGRHLASQGHERLAVIGYDANPFMKERVKGLESAYIESGIGTKHVKYFDADMTKSGGYQAACKVFEDPLKPTAIFTLNDIMAIGVYMAADDKGINIPSDISIIGIDGIELDLLVRPRLSTFILPLYEMGRELFSLLLSRMDGSYKGDARTTEFQGRLVVRESTVSSTTLH